MTSLDRRDFLRLGLVAGPAALVAGCGWDGGPLLRSKLQSVSRLNDWVGEKILLSKGRLARVYPVSARSSTMPGYHISQEMPALEGAEPWTLEVGGEVRAPTALTLSMLQQLPRITYTVKHHCVEGWTAIATWTGVPFSVVADMVQPTSRARFVRFDSFDNGYFNGWDLTSAMHPQTMLAYAFNDRPLMPDHGAPLRLYSPIKLGYKLTKYLTRVTVTGDRPGGYWEDKGYPWLGGIGGGRTGAALQTLCRERIIWRRRDQGRVPHRTRFGIRDASPAAGRGGAVHPVGGWWRANRGLRRGLLLGRRGGVQASGRGQIGRAHV